jgi:hypothetical protein
MSSSTSSSDARASGSSSELGGGAEAVSGKRGGKGSRLFLLSMAGGLLASAAMATALPESWVHTPPEFGMAEAFEDHVTAACAAKAKPELLIIGDSRAVAGVSAQEIAKVGISVEKFALGGSGIFTGWAVLDRLIDCGVRPDKVVMAYGGVHVLDTGAMMERTTNYDLLKGPRASHAFAKAAEWEESTARRLAYKAMSIVGSDVTLVDLVLLQPALKHILEQPPAAVANSSGNEKERASFLASAGDRFYGQANGTSDLPDEKQYTADKAVPRINREASAAIAKLGRDNGFEVLFYLLPVSETAKAKLPSGLFATVERFRGELDGLGIRAINDVWTLPDADFGDPSHVNAIGRAKVTDDLLARLATGELAVGRRADETDNAVSLAAQEGEKIGQ